MTATVNNKTAMERLADSYEKHDEPNSDFTPPARKLDALERLAETYTDAPRIPNADRTPPARPELTPLERLAKTYEKPGDAPREAADAEPDGDADVATNVERDVDAAKPFEFKPDAEGRTIDDSVGTALSEVARELKIDNAAAQKIVDKMQPALDANLQQRVNETVEGWAAETNDDPEIGGTKLNETVRLAQQALGAFGTRELRKLLGPVSAGGSGLGNHPEIVRLLANVGRKLGGLR